MPLKQKSAILFDKKLIATRLARGLKNNDTKQIGFIYELLNNELSERLAIISRKFNKAAIIGPVTHYLPKSSNSANGKIIFNRFATLVPEAGKPLLDAESLQLPDSNYDLIVSLFDLQIVNDVVRYLQNIKTHLAPDGLMILAFIGANSLTELRRAWLEAESEIYGGANLRVMPFIDIKQAGNLLQHSGFTLPVVDIDSHKVRYKSPLDLMQELQIFAASNALYNRSNKLVTKTLLKNAINKYNKIATDTDGRIYATLEIVWLSGWAHHETQQQPLKPGSAQIALRKILSDKANRTK